MELVESEVCAVAETDAKSAAQDKRPICCLSDILKGKAMWITS
jgi:hypothetical protein